MLHRPNTDFGIALSHYLWEQTPLNNDKNHMLQLNDIVHSHIREVLPKYCEEPYDNSSLNVEDEIRKIPSSLWQAVTDITMSKNERLGKSKENHIKRLRRLFIVSAILYCTNEQMSMPLHTLIADMVDSQGGSDRLMQYLNKLGVCVSSDTLLRYIQYRVQKTNIEDGCDGITSDGFTVISADNIDIQHPYAKVSSKGTQASSWHGTSIQQVQPNPSLSIIDEDIEEDHSATSTNINAQTCTTSEDFPSLLQGEHAGQPARTPVHSKGEATSYATTETSRTVNILAEPAEPVTYMCHRLNSRKRCHAYSPLSSPSKIQSPKRKIKRRSRTGKENVSDITTSLTERLCGERNIFTQRPRRMTRENTLLISDFTVSSGEQEEVTNISEEMYTYQYIKYSMHKQGRDHILIDLQNFLSKTQPTHTVKSAIAYLEVMDSVADRKDTVMEMLNNYYHVFIVKQKKKFLVIEGDAKVYDVLQSLKREYGNELEWVIPYPGDWHLLKNFQVPLMKAYYDAGLRELANVAGYPVATIKSCGQFKRTHQFILESWEAIYRVMIEQYNNHRTGTACNKEQLQTLIVEKLLSLGNERTGYESRLSATLTEIAENLQQSISEFKEFYTSMGIIDKTWKFWVRFIFEDAMSYIQLFLAIRSANWTLRVASIKAMAAVFTAFDHNTYQKLIAQHLSDIKQWPDSLLLMFQQGAFVVSISGKPWHSVAIDEAHEMLINKKCKMSIVKSSQERMERIVRYITHRTKSLENIDKQLFPNKQSETQMIFHCTANDKKAEGNIREQISCIEKANLLQMCTHDRELINPFANRTATPEQSHDLRNFRQIGHDEFLLYVKFTILKEPSTAAKKRKKRLQTFSERKVKTLQMKRLEKDNKLLVTAMKRRMEFSKKTGSAIDTSGEQLLELPLAICDNEGKPRKGQKSSVTKVYESRYKRSTPPVFSTELSWIPECVLIEGMMIINSAPLGSHKILSDYASFLIKRFLLPHLHRGAKEIHILFDNPGMLPNTPKQFEQQRRDNATNSTLNHYCDDITSSTPVRTRKWRETFLNCRDCKRKLVKFLGKFFLDKTKSHLTSQQTVYVAGSTDDELCWYVQSSNGVQPEPRLKSNAEETDTRLWLHVNNTICLKVLIESCDTDVYHIGAPLQLDPNKHVIIRISPYNAQQLKYLNLTHFVDTLTRDTDMAAIDGNILTQILQTIYVTTGCDYISFFSQIGKGTFLSSFFQYALFISAGTKDETPGTLACIDLHEGANSHKLGFLAFIRLIGVVYFKKFMSAFEQESPVTNFYKTCTGEATVHEHHMKWLDGIRQTIWPRITKENLMIPSDCALRLHWERSCWVANMWRQSAINNMTLQPLDNHGWSTKDNSLAIIWDSPENVRRVRERVALLFQGCTCKKGCKTRQCKCVKNNSMCSAGCKCLNCHNLHPTLNTSVNDDSASSSDDDIDSSASEAESSIERGIDHIMEFVFGEQDSSNMDD